MRSNLTITRRRSQSNCFQCGIEFGGGVDDVRDDRTHHHVLSTVSLSAIAIRRAFDTQSAETRFHIHQQSNTGTSARATASAATESLYRWMDSATLLAFGSSGSVSFARAALRRRCTGRRASVRLLSMYFVVFLVTYLGRKSGTDARVWVAVRVFGPPTAARHLFLCSASRIQSLPRQLASPKWNRSLKGGRDCDGKIIMPDGDSVTLSHAFRSCVIFIIHCNNGSIGLHLKIIEFASVFGISHRN